MLWLLKKFWEIDIIGKIYILIISFIVIVAILTNVVRYNKAIKGEYDNNIKQNNVIEQQ